MKWNFTIKYERRNIKLEGEIIETDKRKEKIRISGKNRSIIIQSNRPFFVLRGLKHRKLEWKIIDGEMKSNHLLQLIFDEVEVYLKSNPT